MKMKSIGLVALLALSVPLQSMAEIVTVKALENSTTGGTGAVVTTAFTVGQSFTVSVNPLDYWTAGGGLRWSNADGLTGVGIINASSSADPSGDVTTALTGLAAGTVIGTGSFGNHNQGGLAAPFGLLVGAWGNAPSTYFSIGTNFSGVAADSALKLYYFDSNNGDNKGSILADVNVTAVPEPETYAMMLAGLGMIGFMERRRRNNQA